MVSDYEKIYGNIYDNNERKELTARKITELRKENGLPRQCCATLRYDCHWQSLGF